jgi:hypothetical protein
MEIIQNWFKEGCDYKGIAILWQFTLKAQSYVVTKFKKENNSFNIEKLK